MENYYDILIIGGGAAGFFTAINVAEVLPNKRIAILEKAKEGLNKVKISGGGRCNVTHAEFIPKTLTENYPRGEKELLGPFHKFMTGDTFEWFEQRGVPLHIEEDGRVFPVSNSSQTIINCFLNEANKYNVECHYQSNVIKIIPKEKTWEVHTSKEIFQTENLVIATGSSPKVWRMLELIDCEIIPPVPSLFTFHCEDDRLKDLQGMSTEVAVEVLDKNQKVILKSQGPLLVTHWGMSGPAILKLSAWGARKLYAKDYKFLLKINWVPQYSLEAVKNTLQKLQVVEAKKKCNNTSAFNLPKRLWRRLLETSNLSDQRWADLSKKQMYDLILELTAGKYTIDGKSTYKEEFVTAGGLDLKQINFKNFSHKSKQNLYFAGEVLNIDAITGGFNFQNAWTSGYLVAQDLTLRYKE